MGDLIAVTIGLVIVVVTAYFALRPKKCPRCGERTLYAAVNGDYCISDECDYDEYWEEHFGPYGVGVGPPWGKRDVQ